MLTDYKVSEQNMLKGYNMLLYFAGTMIMFDPSQECIYDFWSQGILKTLPVSSRNPKFIKAASQLRESVEDRNIFKKMSEDYKFLFSRQEKPIAPPYESVYLKQDGASINNIPDVHEFYESYGWKSKFKNRIADDHLGIELLFLTLMIEKYLELDDEACSFEMRNEIIRFLDKHILSWINTWNKNIQEGAMTISYKGIGNMIVAVAEDLRSIMAGGEKLYLN